MDRPQRRKLLVASVGIASISYALAACGKTHPISGNLPAPDPTPPTATPIVGNLPAPEPIDAAPPPEPDAAAAAKKDGGK